MSTRLFVPTADIERETGFGKDQLRKWRQRYQFPPPESSADGSPGFSRNTVQKLLQIKRLLDSGFRPGQVVGKTAEELEKLQLAIGLSAPVLNLDASTKPLLEQLKNHDLAGFFSLLVAARSKTSLLGFVEGTVAPFLISLGDAHVRGELEMHDEYLGSTCIKRYLNAEILALKPKRGMPSILFALPPLEHHFLGLYMAEAVLAEQGARTSNLGSDAPLNILKLAAISQKVDVVALSFSRCYPARKVFPTLTHLRRLLPVGIQLWAGGAGLAVLRKIPTGVHIFSGFDASVLALKSLAAQKR